LEDYTPYICYQGTPQQLKVAANRTWLIDADLESKEWDLARDAGDFPDDAKKGFQRRLLRATPVTDSTFERRYLFVDGRTATTGQNLRMELLGQIPNYLPCEQIPCLSPQFRSTQVASIEFMGGS
jgi:hypothetical protein